MPSSWAKAATICGSVNWPMASRIASALRSCSSCLFCRASEKVEKPSAIRETAIERTGEELLGAQGTSQELRIRQSPMRRASTTRCTSFVPSPISLIFLIAIHPRNRIFVHESVAAVNLERLVDDAMREFAGEEFGERGRLHVVAALVFLPSCPEHHQAGVLDLGEHVDELERDGLKLADRTAERVAFFRVFNGLVVRAQSTSRWKALPRRCDRRRES